MAVNNFIGDCSTTALAEWNTATNWSLGHVPDSTEDTTFTGIVAPVVPLTITTTNAVCKSADLSGAGAAFTLAGSPAFSVYGSLTLKTGMTWSQSGNLFVAREASGTLTSNGVSLASVSLVAGGYSSGSLSLADEFNSGTKAFYNYGTLTSNNNTITCGVFGDSSQPNITTTLGSSIVNCSNIYFNGSNPTITANTAAINITSTANITANFGGKTWGGTTTVLMTGGKVLTLNGANTFDKFAISWTTDNILSGLVLGADQTFVNATADAFKLTGAAVISRPKVTSSAPGTHRHLTAATVTVTGAVDFQDITGDGAGSWNLSGIASGNLGGNTGITFRTVDDYYVDFGIANAIMTSNCWSLSSGGGAGGTGVFPLPQDTIWIDDNSWDSTNNILTLTTNHRASGINTSNLSEAQVLSFEGATVYGSMIITGTGISIGNGGSDLFVDARVMSEASQSLILNRAGTGLFGVGAVYIISYAGTVQLASPITVTNDKYAKFILTRGIVDLYGGILTVNVLTSSNANSRAIIDSIGTGKIVVKETTGMTVFDMSTATNLTVSNSPAIDIGTSNLTLTGNVTFAGGGKTFGDFKVTKHAGNFTCDITGANTFGVFTQETPDATYQYAGARFTAATQTNVTSIVADGTASYQITRSSITAATHTISDTAGANTVTYNTITNEIATGGATFDATGAGNVNGGGNTGWTFAAAGNPYYAYAQQ